MLYTRLLTAILEKLQSSLNTHQEDGGTVQRSENEGARIYLRNILLTSEKTELCVCFKGTKDLKEFIPR